MTEVQNSVPAHQSFPGSSLRIMGGEGPANECQLHLNADLWSGSDADIVALHWIALWGFLIICNIEVILEVELHTGEQSPLLEDQLGEERFQTSQTKYLIVGCKHVYIKITQKIQIHIHVPMFYRREKLVTFIRMVELKGTFKQKCYWKNTMCPWVRCQAGWDPENHMKAVLKMLSQHSFPHLMFNSCSRVNLHINHLTACINNFNWHYRL